jgi:hypothetical protein
VSTSATDAPVDGATNRKMTVPDRFAVSCCDVHSLSPSIRRE